MAKQQTAYTPMALLGGAGGTIRITLDKRVSVFDIITFATNVQNPWRVWNDIKQGFPEVLQFVSDFKFPGRGQKPTPVVAKQGFVKLTMLLPGEQGKHFRDTYADVILRYLDGDPTLAEEIIDRQDDPEVLHRLALRAKSIGVRKTFTDMLKLHGAIVAGQINTYAQCTGLLNQGVTGSKAKEIQAYTGIKKTRDAMPSQYLSLMLAGEELATASIQKNHAHGHEELFKTTAVVADDLTELRKKHGIPDWPGAKA